MKEQKNSNSKTTAIAVASALIVSYLLYRSTEHGVSGKVIMTLITTCLMIKAMWKLMIWIFK